jgi:ABC-type lipoprotein export system ATPase subunit
MAFFRELNQRDGLTVILVTHDLEVARKADRAIVLIDGQIAIDTHDIEEAARVLHQRARLDLDDEESEK